MASQEDLAAVRHFYDEVARGNFWVGKEVFDPAIEWEWDSPFGGMTGNRTYRGFREVEEATKEWLGAWDWFRIELEELIHAGEQVVALTRSLGRPRGGTGDVVASGAQVWTMRDGKAIAFRDYADREEARQATGVGLRGAPVLQVALKRAGGIAYREAGGPQASDRFPVLCVHGWPQSSYMWRHLLPVLEAAGRRVLAPDLPGFGDSAPDPPGTWERQVEATERFRREIGLDRVVLVVHDTGGMIGLRWACDHPDAVAGMVITNTAFFPDYQGHALAKALRTEGQGEALVDSLSRDGLAALLEAASSGIDEPAVDEYWKAFSSVEGRRGMLELYRSFNMDELEPYERQLAKLGVPALILFGEKDEVLPSDYAPRFARLIPGAKLVLLETARHFLFEDEPERCAQEVIDFLGQAGV